MGHQESGEMTAAEKIFLPGCPMLDKGSDCRESGGDVRDGEGIPSDHRQTPGSFGEGLWEYTAVRVRGVLTAADRWRQEFRRAEPINPRVCLRGTSSGRNRRQ
jgi:hypothetical protein